MTDCKELFLAIKELDKEKRARNLSDANPDGWTIHTEYHWSRPLKGKRLDYWPSKRKFSYDGIIRVGNVDALIRKLNRKAPGA